MKTRLLLICSAAAGLVGAHALDYRLAYPNDGLRTAVLQHTGHGYLREAVVIAITAGVLGLVGSVVAGFRHDRDAVRWTDFARRLVCLQVAGFGLLEIGERLAAGASPRDLMGRVGVLGLVLQIVVACVAAVLLAAIVRAASVVRDYFEATLDAPSPIPERRISPWSEARGPRRLAAAALSARGPPAPPR